MISGNAFCLSFVYIVCSSKTPLKLRFARKRYNLTRGGMFKLYGLGMEHQALSTCAVDVITDDRGIQTLGVCSMDTQLVRATRNGIEAYACAAFSIALNIIYSMRRAAILGYHLAGAILIIEF